MYVCACMKCCVPLGLWVLRGKVKLVPDVARHCSNKVPSVSTEDYEKGFDDSYVVLFTLVFQGCELLLRQNANKRPETNTIYLLVKKSAWGYFFFQLLKQPV